MLAQIENDINTKGKIVLQRLIKGEKIDLDLSGLSKREWNELMTAFDLKDKLI